MTTKSTKPTKSTKSTNWCRAVVLNRSALILFLCMTDGLTSSIRISTYHTKWLWTCSYLDYIIVTYDTFHILRTLLLFIYSNIRYPCFLYQTIRALISFNGFLAISKCGNKPESQPNLHSWDFTSSTFYTERFDSFNVRQIILHNF